MNDCKHRRVEVRTTGDAFLNRVSCLDCGCETNRVQQPSGGWLYGSWQTSSRDTASIPMLLWCPACGARHVDKGDFATRPHHTHACQECGLCWRPAIVATVGVQFLPGFKDERKKSQ